MNEINAVKYLQGFMTYEDMAAEISRLNPRPRHAYDAMYLRQVGSGHANLSRGLLRALYRTFPDYINFDGSPRNPPLLAE